MKLVVFILMGFFSDSCFAKDHTLKDRQNEIKALAQSTNPKSIPGFVTDNPPEAALNEVHALEGAAERAFVNNKTANDVKEMAETRPYFVLDGEKDPIFVNAKEATKNPKAYLSGPMANRKPQTTYEWQTCRESKPKTEMKCSKVLMSQKVVIEPDLYERRIVFKMYSGYTPHVDAEIRRDFNSSPVIKIQDETVRVQEEKWTNGCYALEKKAVAGVCRRVKIFCPKGEKIREVIGEVLKSKRFAWFDESLGACVRGTRSQINDVEGYARGKMFLNQQHPSKGEGFESTGETKSAMMTRDCWRYEETYECSHPSPNNCEPLRQASCEQMRSKCVTKIGDECVEWEQDYRCPKNVFPEEKEIIAKSGYKMPDVDTNLSYTANNEMNDAIAKLSVLQEMQGDMPKGKNLDSITVFKGQGMDCQIAFLGLKNCCTKKGWGKSMGMSGCEPIELELAERQKRGLCIEVGSYCAKKTALGICKQKKRSSCCFPSKLSRIIHEQGRPQLGIGWGEAKSPDCRGFTPEELARLDFDRLNLSELFEEIASRMKTVSSRVVKRNLTDRIKTMTDGLGNQTESGDF